MTTEQINTQVDGLTTIDDARRQRMAKNKDAILLAMKAAGITLIVVTYEGEGDEGSPTELAIEPEGADLSLATLTIAIQSSQWDEVTRAWSWHDSEVSMMLDEAVSAFVDDVIETHHRGFEDGEGGGGELRFDAAAMSVTYDNFDNVVEREHAGEITL